MNDRRGGLIAWFVENPVAANLLMAFFLFAGVVTVMGMRQEFIPDMQVNVIRVTISYPGAAPEEVEKQVCRKVEGALAGIAGIKRLRSVSEEGFGIVFAEVQFKASVERVREDIRQAVDGLENLPEKARRPVVSVQSITEGVLWLIISGDMDERSLKKISQQVHNELLDLPQVNKASLEGVRDYEIAIEIDDTTLMSYGLTIADIAEAVRKASLNLPMGMIRSDSGEILLRVDGKAQSGADFEQIGILATGDGGIVRLGDVCHIRDGFEDTDWFLRYQGEKAAGIQVFRVGQQSIQDVARAVHEYIGKKQKKLPEGVHLSVIADTSVPLKDQITMMLKNVASGGVLVFLALTLFLRMRLAFWVVAGMPVCFLGTIWVMNLDWFDLSINVLTLFGFILVLGILVDDAIVIGESVHTETSTTGYGVAQTIAGVQRVAMPATFGVLTTMAAFLPIFMLPGVNGRLWGNIAWVVVLCLVFSLIESKLILPAHLAQMGPPRDNCMNRGLNGIQRAVSTGMIWWVDRIYRPSLHLALRWRYTLLAVFLALSMLTSACVKSGIIRFVFFPEFESDTLEIELAMPGGTPFQLTEAMAARVENAVPAVNDQVRKEYGMEADVIRHLVAFSASETGVWFYAELIPAEKRSVSSKEITRIWREQVGSLPGVSRLVFSGSEDDGEPAVDVQLSGSNFTLLGKASAELRDRLSRIGGVYDIRDSLRQGKREAKIALLPGMETFRMSLADIAGQIDHSVYGEKIQTLDRDGEELDVYIRYPKRLRDSAHDVENMWLYSGEGYMKLADIATTSQAKGQLEIERINRKRIVSITADVDTSRVEPGLVARELEEDILPDILNRYPEVDAVIAGQEQGKNEAADAMRKGSLIALFVIYALMAIPLQSYVQPLLIMTAIPFGIIGSIWGHWMLGLPVSVLSLCGIIALAGVVVNDSLVMVHHVNGRRRDGRSLIQAVCSAGPARFRAILLTSLTTFVGLVPMMAEKSLQAQFLIPMAVSLSFGILFATLITLYLIPALYIAGQDLKYLMHRIPGRSRKKQHTVSRISGELDHTSP